MWPGAALEADAQSPLVMPRAVWSLRDQLGQLGRELHMLDTLVVAAWFGQVDAPPVRRALVTAVGNILPVIQAHRLTDCFSSVFSVFGAVVDQS